MIPIEEFTDVILEDEEDEKDEITRSLNCGITAFEMLGRFGFGGQVWLGMDNSNQTKEQLQ